MFDVEIHAIRRALKMLSHEDSGSRDRATAAEQAIDTIEKFLRTLPSEPTPPEAPAPKRRRLRS